MRKCHTKMWHKILLAVTIATISAVTIIYVTYFQKASVEEILSNNKRQFGRMSRKALGQNGEAGINENIDLQIANYQADRWERWLHLMNYVSVGELYDKCGKLISLHCFFIKSFFPLICSPSLLITI